jgi:hypothetical protein
MWKIVIYLKFPVTNGIDIDLGKMLSISYNYSRRKKSIGEILLI